MAINYSIAQMKNPNDKGGTGKVLCEGTGIRKR